MFALSARSTVIVSLLQVGVTVLGVLASATSQKLATALGHAEVFSTELLLDSALSIMLLPLVWISIVTVARTREEVSEDAKRSAFITGFLLLGLLFLLAGYGVVRPWTGPIYALQ